MTQPTAKVIPAKTETKTVEIEPARIELSLSLDQAARVVATLGLNTGDCGTSPTYSALNAALRGTGAEKYSFFTVPHGIRKRNSGPMIGWRH